LRFRADPFLDGGPVPDGDDPSVGYGKRFGGGREIVDGENCSENDPVSGRHHAILSGL
jgi:hypothetical protein